MRRVCFTIMVVASALFLAGCNKTATTTTAQTSQTNQAAVGPRQVYKTRGVVKEIVSPERARIAHEAIPGYMPAMTMPLDVKDPKQLAGVKVGDQISFDMVVTDDDGWIENVKRL